MRRWLLPLAVVALGVAAVPTVRANWFQSNMNPYPGYYHPSYYFPGAPYLAFPQNYYGGYGVFNEYVGGDPAAYAAYVAQYTQSLAATGVPNSVAPGFGVAPTIPAPCPPGYTVRYEQRIVTGTRPEWKSEKVEITAPKVTYKEEVTQVKAIVMVPKIVDSTQLRTEHVPVPRQVERVVTTCRTVPYLTTCPCTGCPTIGCQIVPETHKLSTTVLDYQPRVHNVPIKVTRVVPEERLVPQTQMVPVVTQEKTWTIRNVQTMVPYQQTITVPVYTAVSPPGN